jgi:hypothetical protein
MKSKSIKSLKSLKSALLAAASSILMTSAFAASIDGTTSVQIGGKVKSVDASTHQVTVTNAKGGTESFQVGANVTNLDKLKVGTNVTGTTLRAVRLTVLDSSTLAAVPAQDASQTVASVTRIDAQRGLMVLKDTQGSELTVQANSPAEAASLVLGTRLLVDVVNTGR